MKEGGGGSEKNEPGERVGCGGGGVGRERKQQEIASCFRPRGVTGTSSTSENTPCETQFEEHPPKVNGE
ncbi:hypothetical protein CDAR_315981 [Caerostris darwini]|uniref:Uncharacterized protein n=1 Tax=Caerostris darwini TaxID=1538125 RepID=A0AAV4MA61_9ARAC|nr:hypothetical protein CDAR_315981 [Caerostris darwini]